MIERLLDKKEVSKKELSTTDYQVIREMEKIFPKLLELLKKNSISTDGIDMKKINTEKRTEARKRIKSS